MLAGPSGVGKTHAIQTLVPARTLVIDVDRGALPLRNFPVDIIRPSGWPEIADLFVAIGRPNPSLPPTSAYSEAHFEKARGLIDVDRYDVIVFDSITQVGRELYRYAEAYPESPPRSGSKDTRAAYGQHARQMIAGLQHAQRGAPNKVIILTAILERVVDDAKSLSMARTVAGRPERSRTAWNYRSRHHLQLDRLQRHQAAYPCFCLRAERLGYPAKSRADWLDPIEPPDLGKLIRKLLTPAQPATQED